MSIPAIRLECKPLLIDFQALGMAEDDIPARRTYLAIEVAQTEGGCHAAGGRRRCGGAMPISAAKSWMALLLNGAVFMNVLAIPPWSATVLVQTGQGFAVIALQIVPEIRGDPQDPFELQGCLRGDRCFALDDFVDRLGSTSAPFGQFGLGHAESLKSILKSFSRRDGVIGLKFSLGLATHGYPPRKP